MSLLPKQYVEEYLGGYRCLMPFQQLTQAIETETAPDSSVQAARMGVEVLMAAYQSSIREGELVLLPLETGENPLVNLG